MVHDNSDKKQSRSVDFEGERTMTVGQFYLSCSMSNLMCPDEFTRYLVESNSGGCLSFQGPTFHSHTKLALGSWAKGIALVESGWNLPKSIDHSQ